MTETTAGMVLYHVLNDDDCAEVRRFIVNHNLIDQVQFRNIDRSDEASKALLALRGDLRVPVLVCGSEVALGKTAILEQLKSKRFL